MKEVNIYYTHACLVARTLARTHYLLYITNILYITYIVVLLFPFTPEVWDELALIFVIDFCFPFPVTVLVSLLYQCIHHLSPLPHHSVMFSSPLLLPANVSSHSPPMSIAVFHFSILFGPRVQLTLTNSSLSSSVSSSLSSSIFHLSTLFCKLGLSLVSPSSP